MTVLVDTSVWADHLRSADATLVALIEARRVVMHPFVLGELAMGNLRDRTRTVMALDALPPAPLASPRAFLEFVADKELGGSGLGFVDAHLLASASLGTTTIWTRDRRLAERAATLSLRWTA